MGFVDFLRAKDLVEFLTLVKSKSKAKGYKDQPDDYYQYSGYIFTCCIEKTIISEQLILAISRADKRPIVEMPGEMLRAIDEVFGPEVMMQQTVFPKRGETRMFVWAGGE